MTADLIFSKAGKMVRFVERVNRFMMICEEDDGSELSVHLADSGRLKELLMPGAELFIEEADNPARKTRYTALMVKHETRWVGINSTIPNKLVRQSLLEKKVPGLPGWSMLKAEYALGRERFDFLLEKDGVKMILEVKGVSLLENGIALFPDAVTARGARHVRHLTELSRQGRAAGIYFVIQRDDAIAFAPNRLRDPIFSEAINEALESGLKVWAHSCLLMPDKILWQSPVPFISAMGTQNV
ncbi:MAG TPA: DNA/RNA nuclease SfsA [Candidatus Marinimicrobia bacterium]|nr:DNA/RNA nuclease SfsA [Candidatus Neomarinimicrobiota bacterium]